MLVGDLGVLIGMLAMFMGGRSVRFRLVMLTLVVMMGRLMVVMGRRVMMSGSRVMMLAGRVLLFRHLVTLLNGHFLFGPSLKPTQARNS